MQLMTEGTKVTYVNKGVKEHGIIKSFPKDSYYAFVVYHCNNDWNEYQSYTGQRTEMKYLKPGWL